MRITADAPARIALVADMSPATAIDRMPEPRNCQVAGLDIPVLALDPFQASAAVKLRFALMAVLDPGLLQR